jgi:hypothetical protein
MIAVLPGILGSLKSWHAGAAAPVTGKETKAWGDLCSGGHSTKRRPFEQYRIWSFLWSVVISHTRKPGLIQLDLGLQHLRNRGNGCGRAIHPLALLHCVVCCIVFWQDWGLNSGLCSCRAGALLLEPLLQSGMQELQVEG